MRAWNASFAGRSQERHGGIAAPRGSHPHSHSAALGFALAIALLLIAAKAVGGTLCGTVRDAATAAPIAHAGLFLRATSGAYTGRYTATDEAGAFCFLAVPPDTYDVEVRVDDYRIAYVRGVVVSGAVDVEIPAASPPFSLSRPWPNPALSSVRIEWAQPSGAAVRVSVSDTQGRLVRAWGADHMPAGSHSLVWNLCDPNGRAVPPGVYFIQLEAGGARCVRPLVRIR